MFTSSHPRVRHAGAKYTLRPQVEHRGVTVSDAIGALLTSGVVAMTLNGIIQLAFS